MHWLQTLDTHLFLFCNRSLANPWFDWLMPILSGGRGAKTALIASAVLVGLALLGFGNARARICVLMTALIVGTNDGLLVNTLKHAVGRPRPFVTLPEARVFGEVGKGYIPPVIPAPGRADAVGPPPGTSMPSAHAANWFAATMVLFLFYRSSVRIMLPMALAVSFSRIYNGVHYPSDVLAGAILGAGYAVAAAVALESAWQFVGKKWFPRWHARLPLLVPPFPARDPKIG